MAVGPDRFLSSVKALSKSISTEKPENIALITHKGADVDALASASALRNFLLHEFPRANVTVHSLGKLPSKSIGAVNFLGLDVTSEKPEISGSSWVFLVDTGGWRTSGISRDEITAAGHRILVDHHLATELDLYDIVLHQHLTSTSEVVLELFKLLSYDPGGDTATALLAGIMTDTAGLREADDKTFEHLCELKSYEASMPKALEIISRETSRGERIARLKAAQRMKIYRIGELVITLTEIGSFHSSAASSLVKLGADLAIVFSGDDRGSKASLRASRKFSDVSSLSLGNTSSELAEQLGGHGGGHVRAGALSSEKGIKESMALVEKFITKHLSR